MIATTLECGWMQLNYLREVEQSISAPATGRGGTGRGIDGRAAARTVHQRWAPLAGWCTGVCVWGGATMCGAIVVDKPAPPHLAGGTIADHPGPPDHHLNSQTPW
eukprot:gene19240-biopygen23472